MVVVGDVAHQIVDPDRAEVRRGNLTQARVHVRQVGGWGRCAVLSPHDHRRLADLALGDPAELVLEVTRRDDRTFAEIAAVTHFTCKMTFESFATFVPAAGASETTLVQVGVAPDPGPVVE